jgi:hypothetical protein
MVYEIYMYLKSYKKINSSSAYNWVDIYKNILTITAKFRGTIPNDVKAEMIKRTDASKK